MLNTTSESRNRTLNKHFEKNKKIIMIELSNVLELFEKKNWQEIIERYHDHPDRSGLLWVFPSEENFKFLRDCARELECDAILSIGCGSGLLEWMITEATGIPVTGVEIDGGWWHCKYAPPTFIPLLVTSICLDDNKEVVHRLRNSDTTALLFCYFNNRPAFEDYLRHYSGSVLIIIGPGDGKGVHTDPKPFNDVPNNWVLYKYQEVRNSRDFLAIYCKQR